MNHDKCLLLVDDNRNDLDLIRRIFESQKVGCPIVIIADGVEALDYLFCRGQYSERTSGNPVAVLLDLKMPRVDGFEVLQQIKGDPKLKTIPVVIFTSSNQSDDVGRCYEMGANAYVVKPVEYKELADRVKQIGLFWTLVNEPSPAVNANVEAEGAAATA
ncbi:MAG: response regulator [Verrucomicrobia bacterium]|nr:response regulator [Verrucomicrobiota bacterium]